MSQRDVLSHLSFCKLRVLYCNCLNVSLGSRVSIKSHIQKCVNKKRMIYFINIIFK